MDKEIFLVTLLIFSAGSQVLGGMKDKEARKIFREVEGTAFKRKKSPRSVGPENQSNPGLSLRSSDTCPKGTHRRMDKCSKCKRCTDDNTIVAQECRDNQDTVCSCAAGYFNDEGVHHILNCRKCTNCASLHKKTAQACRQDEDAECKFCLPGFCEDKKTCVPCATETAALANLGEKAVFASTMAPGRIGSTPRIAKDEQCNVACKIAVGACGCIFLLVGALILYFKKRKMTSHQEKPVPAPNIYISSPYFGSPVASLPETVMLVDKAPPPSRSLQQGRKLYTVINAVPVRRWKEFVRGLGLQDSEIELVELEHSQFREQQYEMLKRWCQQRGPSLEAILDTLEAMQLGGCAQELREKLQREHLWGNP
ncbi:tumor necrosis factor receptor superfamily member 25 isoform X2 [Crotalus tigris]|uniref:tumor necrosis factor receptor superfamily member 25 isoform X2 n=1 Tax=Crotalus tigris TaxID=88082 RepID=UPI00192F9D4E|nr:tumor necrosis factor receptor superfamily member 25 isoform X2 [Crotalus tigris]